MRLSWDEIKRRAKAFSEEWREAHYEKGETQSFYNDFFEIFGIKRRTVAVYEQRVKLLGDKHGFMDLFWPRTPASTPAGSPVRTPSAAAFH